MTARAHLTIAPAHLRAAVAAAETRILAAAVRDSRQLDAVEAAEATGRTPEAFDALVLRYGIGESPDAPEWATAGQVFYDRHAIERMPARIGTNRDMVAPEPEPRRIALQTSDLVSALTSFAKRVVVVAQGSTELTTSDVAAAIGVSPATARRHAAAERYVERLSVGDGETSVSASGRVFSPSHISRRGRSRRGRRRPS